MIHNIFDAGDKRYGPYDPLAEGAFSGTYGTPKFSDIPIKRVFTPEWWYDRTEDWWKSYAYKTGTEFVTDDVLRIMLIPAGTDIRDVFIHNRALVDMNVQFRLVTADSNATEVAYSDSLSMLNESYIRVEGWKVGTSTPTEVELPFLTQQDLYLELIVGEGDSTDPAIKQVDLTRACFSVNALVYVVHDHRRCGCEEVPCTPAVFPPAPCY